MRNDLICESYGDARMSSNQLVSASNLYWTDDSYYIYT